MTDFAKAQLCELGSDNKERPGTQVDVQFNPTSLRVSISNKTAGGQQAGSQTRQRPGTGEIQVSFDLVFDTADEGTTDKPVAVTRKTMIVEKFVRPPAGATPQKQAPPRVQFKWGSFLVQGVMESANVDLDLFSADGVPLRAKVAVSIKGQDPSWRYDPATTSGSGAPNAAGGAPRGPREPPQGAPGTQGGSDAPSKIVPAMPGESLQQLAARNGLDPSAWRALARDIANPLSLAAGIEIGLPSTLVGSARDVSGATSAAFDPARVAASVPLVDATSMPSGGATNAAANPLPDPVRAGQAVAQQGGVAGAIARVRSDAQRGAVDAARSGFGMAPAASATDTGLHRPYGGGIPLRPPRGAATGLPPVTANTTLPGWEALPMRAAPRGRALDRRRPVDACGCDCAGGRRRGKG